MGKPLKKRRRPAWLPVTIIFLTLLVMLWLGSWQLNRAGQKQDLLDRFSATDNAVTMSELANETPEQLRYRQARLSGHYRSDRQFLAEGFSHEGRPGLHVLTPFQLDNDGIVIVNRGWIPETPTRTTDPDLDVGQVQRALAGRIVPFPRPGLRLDSEPGTRWPRRIVYPTSQDIADALEARVYPHMIWLDADAEDGFVRDWKPSEFGPERHIGYAVQWFAMAAALVLIFIVLRLRRNS